MKKIDVVLLSLMFIAVMLMMVRIVDPINISAILIFVLLIIIDTGIIIKMIFDRSKDHFSTLLLWVCLTLICAFILFVTKKEQKIEKIKESTEIIYIAKN